MISDSRALELVSNNLANSRTPAFRPERPIFSSIEPPEPARRAGVVINTPRSVAVQSSWHDLNPSSIRETGQPFDIAIRGPGWFRVETPNGERLTRNGMFTRDIEGRLTTMSGLPVLNNEGEALNIPTGTMTVDQEGFLSVDGTPIGRLGIVESTGNVVQEGDSLWRSEGGVADSEQPEIAQGFVEESSVQPTQELITMIQVQRAFERQQKVVDLTANVVARQALDLAGVE